MCPLACARGTSAETPSTIHWPITSVTALHTVNRLLSHTHTQPQQERGFHKQSHLQNTVPCLSKDEVHIENVEQMLFLSSNKIFSLMPLLCHQFWWLFVTVVETWRAAAILAESRLSSWMKRFHLLRPTAYHLKWQKRSGSKSVFLSISYSRGQWEAVGCQAGSRLCWAAVMCSLCGGHRCYLLCARSYSVFPVLSLSSKWTTLTAGERWPDC